MPITRAALPMIANLRSTLNRHPEPLAGRVVTLVAAGTLAFALAACTSAPSPSPTLSPTTGPSASASPAAASPSAGECTVLAQTGMLRSNTLINSSVYSNGIVDGITFQLGAMASDPTGSSGGLKAVNPPFVGGGSGLRVEVLGDHFVELHFDGMLIADGAGTPIYLGQASVTPDMFALEQVEMTEAFEGVYNFVIGYRGNGCVALVEDAAAKTLTITIGH